jgi:hypothetical protein
MRRDIPHEIEGLEHRYESLLEDYGALPRRDVARPSFLRIGCAKRSGLRQTRPINTSQDQANAALSAYVW